MGWEKSWAEGTYDEIDWRLGRRDIEEIESWLWSQSNVKKKVVKTWKTWRIEERIWIQDEHYNRNQTWKAIERSGRKRNARDANEKRDEIKEKPSGRI
jgi:hypothetical protein